MQDVHANVLTRDDTFFGVCQAIGEDFGFSPNWLRAAFGVALIWAPLAAIGCYAAIGLVVAFSRLVVRNPRTPKAAAAEPAAAVTGDNDTAPELAAAA